LRAGWPVILAPEGGIIYNVVRRHFGTEQVLKWNFKGPVEHVRYTNDKPLEITVNRKRYILSYAVWDMDIKIYTGDTVIKEKGSLVIKLIRKNSKDTIYVRKRHKKY